jgi:hypothetical protein
MMQRITFVVQLFLLIIRTRLKLYLLDALINMSLIHRMHFNFQISMPLFNAISNSISQFSYKLAFQFYF